MAVGEVGELVGYPFMQNMLIAGFLASLACGMIGTYIVVKRIVFISGGISHTTFGGIGLAYLLQDSLGWLWFNPLYGAVAFALAAASIMGSSWVRSKMREDSTIGMIWVMGMALGALFLNFVDRNAVIVRDPMSILFGNILLIQRTDLYIMGILVLVIIIVTAVFYNDLQILTFDEEFAKISGINTAFLNLLLLVLIALTIVVLIKVVGVVLIIAMLTIPAATSGIFTNNLRNMMLLAVLIGEVMTALGIFLSVLYDLPPGTTIVLIMGTIFLLSLFGQTVYSSVRSKALAE